LQLGHIGKVEKTPFYIGLFGEKIRPVAQCRVGVCYINTVEKFCLKAVYSRLGDEESRFLFKERLHYSLVGDLLRMINKTKLMSRFLIYYNIVIF
jgi:hypothetical protein